jgi:hypothetical protein
MTRPMTSRLATLPVAAVLALVAATTAEAHEPRTSGGFRFVVGWGDEPTYTGVKNSLQVIVSEANGNPVTDLGDSLKLEVSKGSERLTLPLQANFGAAGSGVPGDYRAWLIPTRPGTYAVRLTGTIRGQNVDETFTSGSTTFNEVEDDSTIQFPAKDPSAGEVATRLDRQFPRLETGLRSAEDRVDKARTVAVLAVAVSAVSLVLAALALVVSRRRRPGRDPGAAGARTQTDAAQAETLHR